MIIKRPKKPADDLNQWSSQEGIKKVLASGDEYNILDSISEADKLAVSTAINTKLEIANKNSHNFIKIPTKKNYTIKILIRLQIAVKQAGLDILPIEIRRALPSPNDKIISKIPITVKSSEFLGTYTLAFTYSNGELDAFSTDGFTMFIKNTTTHNVTICPNTDRNVNLTIDTRTYKSKNNAVVRYKRILPDIYPLNDPKLAVVAYNGYMPSNYGGIPSLVNDIADEGSNTFHMMPYSGHNGFYGFNIFLNDTTKPVYVNEIVMWSRFGYASRYKGTRIIWYKSGVEIGRLRLSTAANYTPEEITHFTIESEIDQITIEVDTAQVPIFNFSELQIWGNLI